MEYGLYLAEKNSFSSSPMTAPEELIIWPMETLDCLLLFSQNCRR